MDRRLRLANSSPDVKALFNNSPPYVYHLDEGRDSLDSQPNFVPGPVGEYWNPQPPIVRHGRYLSMSHVVDDMSQGSGIPSRTRHVDDATKRGSDSLLEAKLKEQLGKPRSLQNRAQSLDLTASLSRITESSRLVPPDSPTNSVGDTGPSSSPTSATAPSFPSVYGPPSSVRPSGIPGTPQSMRRTGRVLDDEAIDEVSRVISNLGL